MRSTTGICSQSVSIYHLNTNDLPNCLTSCKAMLFADDTTLYALSVNIGQLYETINSDLELLTEWFLSSKLFLNVGKTQLCRLQM